MAWTINGLVHCTTGPGVSCGWDRLAPQRDLMENILKISTFRMALSGLPPFTKRQMAQSGWAWATAPRLAFGDWMGENLSISRPATTQPLSQFWLWPMTAETG